MTEDSVEAIFGQASTFMQRVVDAYESDIAPGEVGPEASAEASLALPTREGGTTGLLYGRVQSGKTAAMIASAALALDNGFRLVVVLTANNVTLVRQTAERFRNLEGVQVLSTATDGRGYEWEGQEADLAEDLPEEGLVLVSAKETTHLPNVVRFLQGLDAAGRPALVFDDEADAATPDTTLAARTLGRPSARPFPSPTYRRVVENHAPGEEGVSIREVLPHHVFVQVTATPFVLFLQRGDSPLRPRFVHMMEPGEGYCGGEAFFGSYQGGTAVQQPPIVLVPDRDAQQLQVARRNAPAPEGLQASVMFFLLAATAHSLLKDAGKFPSEGYKHLSHTSSRQAHHEILTDVLRRHLRLVRRSLRPVNRAGALASFDAAYQELRRTEAELGSALPTLDALLDHLQANFSQHHIIMVNATTREIHYGRTYNFVVGGNILSRGVTIDDLLVTYYLREAQVSQMDTVWQHARMYGYRSRLMPFTRVYLPDRLAALFRGIHEAEEDLRAVLPELAEDAPVPLRVVTGTRATRPNALQPNAVQVYAGGRQVRPFAPVTDECVVTIADERIRERLEQLGVPTNEARIDDRFHRVSIDDLIDLARMTPVAPDDPGRWDTEGVAAVLLAVSDQFGGEGFVYVRSTATERDDAGLPTGVLTGDEQRRAARKNLPTLTLIFRAREPNGVFAFWFPTLVLPSGMGRVVFNSL